MLQLVAPTPGIGDLVDYFDATVLARGRVTLPFHNIDILIKRDPAGKPTWWKRVWKKPAALFPRVRVTIELVRAGVSLTPVAAYQNELIFKHALEEYAIRLHSRISPCDIDYVPVLGTAVRIEARDTLGQELGIGGQLDALLRAARIGTPIPAQEQRRLFWIVYSTFPDSIRSVVIPRDRVLLDEFVFDKSFLTDVHGDKIGAIARHVVATARSAGEPPAIALAGHTDDRGTETYNDALGDRRARAVNEALRKAIDDLAPGLSQRTNINVRSFGEKKPALRARNEAEHARNRRVEVLIQKSRPRCKRVSLRASVRRSLGLLKRLSDNDRARRLDCMLRKMLVKGSDDRWVFPNVVPAFSRLTAPFDSHPFSLLRDHLSNPEMYAPASPDAAILRSLETIDEQIIGAIAQVNERIRLLTGAASTGVAAMSEMKAMDALRRWMHERVNDPKSIYHCYRNV